MPGGALPTTPDGAWRPGSVGRQIGSRAIPASDDGRDDRRVDARRATDARAGVLLARAGRRAAATANAAPSGHHATPRIAYAPMTKNARQATPASASTVPAARRASSTTTASADPKNSSPGTVRSVVGCHSRDPGRDLAVRRQADGVDPDRRAERVDAAPRAPTTMATSEGPPGARPPVVRRPRARRARRRPGRGRSCRGGSPRRATMSGTAQMSRGRARRPATSDERRAPAGPSRTAAAGGASATADDDERRERQPGGPPRVRPAEAAREEHAARTGARRGAPGAARARSSRRLGRPRRGSPGRPTAGRARARRTPCTSTCRSAGCRGRRGSRRRPAGGT